LIAPLTAVLEVAVEGGERQVRAVDLGDDPRELLTPASP
jgi:hypothetical protein